MRVLSLLFSATLFTGGIAASLALASARYDGAAQHSMLIALLTTAAASLFGAIVTRFVLSRVQTRRKIIFYMLLTGLASAGAVLHAVGLDGILPKRDGAQSVGLATLFVNMDLFGLIIVVTALSCRGAFRLKKN